MSGRCIPTHPATLPRGQQRTRALTDWFAQGYDPHWHITSIMRHTATFAGLDVAVTDGSPWAMAVVGGDLEMLRAALAAGAEPSRQIKVAMSSLAASKTYADAAIGAVTSTPVDDRRPCRQ